MGEGIQICSLRFSEAICGWQKHSFVNTLLYVYYIIKSRFLKDLEHIGGMKKFK